MVGDARRLARKRRLRPSKLPGPAQQAQQSSCIRKAGGNLWSPSHPAPFRAVASLGKSPGLRGFESSVKDSKEGTPRGGAIAGTNGGKASMAQDRTTRRICIAPEH